MADTVAPNTAIIASTLPICSSIMRGGRLDECQEGSAYNNNTKLCITNKKAVLGSRFRRVYTL